jgi:Leucine-rich repeat (LRR) protein
LYLEDNLIWNWDQFFTITKQIRFLNTLNLSGNRMKKIDRSYMENKNVNELMNPHLKILVLLGMKLEWSQIDAISPALTFVEELHLCRNNCSIISSEFDISKDVWRNLKFLNLEENNISDFEEIQGFRKLNKLKKLGLGINQIKHIKYRPGFRELFAIDIFENMIDNYESIDQLNEFHGITRLRISDNPITSSENKDKTRLQIFSRLKYLEYYNGSKVGEREKLDCELFYIKI